jgi:hypothetical protein
VAGPALELPPWQHVAVPDPIPEERGVRAPEANWRDRPIGAWLPHAVAPDPLGVRAGGGHPRVPCPHGHVGVLDLYELGGGGVRRPRSQLSGPGRTSRLPGDKGEVTDNLVSIMADSLPGDSLTG